MGLIVLLLLILIGNCLFSQVLVFIPLNILNYLQLLGWYGLIIVLVVLLSWCFGD